eukprot:scaffold58302_cov72-Phaeocystis_antarctica.AAC.1
MRHEERQDRPILARLAHIHAREERQLLPHRHRVLRCACRHQVGDARHDHGLAFARELVGAAQADGDEVAAEVGKLGERLGELLLRRIDVGVEDSQRLLTHLVLQRLALLVGDREHGKLVEALLQLRPASALEGVGGCQPRR